MQRLINRVALFLIPILAFLVAYEVIMRNIENDYSYKNRWLTDNGKKVELLAIGSSHCYYGFDPSYMFKNSFNIGHHSQSIKYDYLILNKFINWLDSLQYIIVTISYPDPYYFMEDTPDVAYFLKQYGIYYHLPVGKVKNKFECLNGIDYLAVINYFSKKVSFNNCSELGLCYSDEYDIHWKENAARRAKQHSFDDFYGPIHQKLVDNINLNMTYMEHIINMCRNKDVQVILLTTPIHKLYREHINEEQWKLTTGFCHHLVQEFDNVSYINLFQDSRFKDEDFLDSDHLNATGAKKLTLILNDYINENFPN